MEGGVVVVLLIVLRYWRCVWDCVGCEYELDMFIYCIRVLNSVRGEGRERESDGLCGDGLKIVI